MSSQLPVSPSPASSVWNLNDGDRLAEPSPPVPEIPPPPTESIFHNTILDVDKCENPDAVLVSLDGTKFETRMDLLAGASDAFKDIFELDKASQAQASTSPSNDESKPTNPDESDAAATTTTTATPPALNVIELTETSHTISLLLTVIHTPPPILPTRPPRKFVPGEAVPDPKRDSALGISPPPEGLLPFANVRELLHPLSEKYAFVPELVRALKSHLAEHTIRYPMEVYMLANELTLTVGHVNPELKKEMEELASDASQYLLSPTLSSLPVSAAFQFPTAQSFAILLRLQLYRIDRLREILGLPDTSRGSGSTPASTPSASATTSDVFPHDYNYCSTHGSATRTIWARAKKDLASELDAGTDVGTEMGKRVLPAVRHCTKCTAGVTAAMQMIQYVVFKVPRRISDLPPSVLQGNA